MVRIHVGQPFFYFCKHSSLLRGQADLGDVELSEDIEDGDHVLVVGLVGAFDDDLQVGGPMF